jgi:hypothetical protein
MKTASSASSKAPSVTYAPETMMLDGQGKVYNRQLSMPSQHTDPFAQRYV